LLKSLVAAVGVIMAAIITGACSGAPAPTADTTATPALFATISGTIQSATLPPTWTPTFTPSPAPPTITPTPTLSPTAVPTLTAAEICEGFTLFYEIPERRVYRREHAIPFVFSIAAPDVVVSWQAVHRRTGQGNRMGLTGGRTYLFDYAVNTLAQPGLYDWTLHVDSPVYGEICARSGTFIVLWLTPLPMPSPTPTPDS
jgi:hypothetical protein